ncbi:MIPEP-like protein [Mya arenaria]|uniref:MIPEP-like protein n=1 Tax=Mya arenaria TaxID=6604 RepID=A0ABY7G5U6_MYAAR|nr:MIPEP-like protein [Mya arenaria]
MRPELPLTCTLYSVFSAQDSLFTIQGGKQLQDGKYQLPIVVLHLNLHRPSSGTPCLLSPSNLDNLFHEFGHAMHAMLGRQQYQHVTVGKFPFKFSNLDFDFLKVHIKQVLKTFARHYRTGEPLDSDILRNVCRSKKLFLYSDTQQQIFYSIMDLVFHGPDFSPRTPIQILEEVQNQYYGIPYVNNTAWHQRFSHLPGYGSKYYSYQVSRSIASKIWRQMFKKDPFSRENDLLGETPTIEMLVKSLSEDLHTRNITASPLRLAPRDDGSDLVISASRPRPVHPRGMIQSHYGSAVSLRDHKSILLRPKQLISFRRRLRMTTFPSLVAAKRSGNDRRRLDW